MGDCLQILSVFFLFHRAMTFRETFPRLATPFRNLMTQVMGALREPDSNSEIIRTIVLPLLIQIEEMFCWLLKRQRVERDGESVHGSIFGLNLALDHMRRILLEPLDYESRRRKLLRSCDQFLHIVTERAEWYRQVI